MTGSAVFGRLALYSLTCLIPLFPPTVFSQKEIMVLLEHKDTHFSQRSAALSVCQPGKSLLHEWSLKKH